MSTHFGVSHPTRLTWEPRAGVAMTIHEYLLDDVDRDGAPRTWYVLAVDVGGKRYGGKAVGSTPWSVERAKEYVTMTLRRRLRAAGEEHALRVLEQ